MPMLAVGVALAAVPAPALLLLLVGLHSGPGLLWPECLAAVRSRARPSTTMRPEDEAGFLR